MGETALRHAWLIMAHGNFPILEKQLRFLDSENADFFIHIDAKVKDFDFDAFRAIPKKSSVTFTDRIRVSWGHESQIHAELILLRAALPGHYDYYHLLSGVDVPSLNNSSSGLSLSIPLGSRGRARRADLPALRHAGPRNGRQPGLS